MIHRLRPWAIGAALLGVFLLPHPALAAEPIQTVLDGRPLAFDVPPMIENDRTLVPVRGLLEALGARVGWEPESRTVTATFGPTVVQAVIGEPVATVDGRPVALDVAPLIVENRTLIPLRFFVESLGMGVEWEGATRTVFIESSPRTLDGSRSGAESTGVAASRTAGVRSGERAAELAGQLLGLPYQWGGTRPETGFDCSGFVGYVYGQLGESLPRTSYEMFEIGVPVLASELQAGDLLFYDTDGTGASHVAIYDGNGGFVHAQSAETGVKRTELSREWWSIRYLGARRVLR